MRGPGLSRCKVATPEAGASDNCRNLDDALEFEAWLAFKAAIRGMKLPEIARRCACSEDAVKLWVKRKRRLPAKALVAMGIVGKERAA